MERSALCLAKVESVGISEAAILDRVVLMGKPVLYRFVTVVVNWILGWWTATKASDGSS